MRHPGSLTPVSSFRITCALVALSAAVAACGDGKTGKKDGGSGGGSSGASTSGGGGSSGMSGALMVMYDGNGATGGSVPADPNTYAQGATVTVLGNPGDLVYPGYSFIGWQSEADGSGTTFVAGNTFTFGTASVTLYALWAGGYAYAVNHNEGSAGDFSQYAIGPNGALSPLVPLMVPTAGNDPRTLLVDPASKYLYVPNIISYDIGQFTIDPANGSLSPMSPPTVDVSKGSNDSNGAIHPSGQWLYEIAGNSVIYQYAIGPSGALTQLASVQPQSGNSEPVAIAIDPTGAYAYAADQWHSVDQYKIDATSGALGWNGSVQTPAPASGYAQPDDIKVLAIGSREYVYVTDDSDPGTIWQYSVNADGTLTYLNGVGVASAAVCTCGLDGYQLVQAAANDLAFHPSGKYAYVTFSCCSLLLAVAQFDVDQSSGALSPMATPAVEASGSSASIAVESSGKYAYVTSGDTGYANSEIAQYTIDPATGMLTLMANPTVQTQAIGPSGIVTIGK